MRLPLILLLLLASGLVAEEIACQRLTMQDGRSIVGRYSAADGTIAMVDEKTGRTIGSMSIDAAKIAKSEDIRIVTKPVDPLDVRGVNGKWITSYAAALKLAADTKRPILMLFTGSDWCPWCKKLEKEILSTDQFKAWAKENVVLLYLDFPQERKLAKDLAAQNEMLKAKFGNTGYPHILFVNAKEERSSYQGGYFEGGVEKWLQEVESHRAEFIKKN